MRRAVDFVRGQRGAAAAEFALVLPGVVFLVFGMINMGVVLYAATTLHGAVQQAARYAATQKNVTGTNPGSTAVTGYASGHYLGPAIGVNFSYVATGSCNSSTTGHQVTGTGNYRIAFGLGSVAVPLSATACFP